MAIATVLVMNSLPDIETGTHPSGSAATSAPAVVLTPAGKKSAGSGLLLTSLLLMLLVVIPPMLNWAEVTTGETLTGTPWSIAYLYASLPGAVVASASFLLLLVSGALLVRFIGKYGSEESSH